MRGGGGDYLSFLTHQISCIQKNLPNRSLTQSDHSLISVALFRSQTITNSTQATNPTNCYELIDFRIPSGIVGIPEDSSQIRSQFVVKPGTHESPNELRIPINAYESIMIQLLCLRMHHEFVTN